MKGERQAVRESVQEKASVQRVAADKLEKKVFKRETEIMHGKREGKFIDRRKELN